MNKPRISIFVITYNQEDVICRTLDSLLIQKDYIYEICINDDCSKDKTFEILQDYQRRYPDIVKPVQNEHNLGIFANTEAVIARLTGDIIYDLAGDDVCPDGYFKEVLRCIEDNHIDWQKELFCIHGDYLEIEPNGNSKRFSNQLVLKHDALKLKVRKLIGNRSSCFSKKVLDKFEKGSEGKSFNAEYVQDCQISLFSEKHYYIPVVGNIYYAGIGISTRMTDEQKRQNVIEGYDRLIDFVRLHGHPFDKKDLAFINFIKAHCYHQRFKSLYYWVQSIDLALGIRGLGLDRIVNSIRKKL